MDEVIKDVELPTVGDYVLATKYSDGDPGDPWALAAIVGVRVESV